MNRLSIKILKAMMFVINIYKRLRGLEYRVILHSNFKTVDSVSGVGFSFGAKLGKRRVGWGVTWVIEDDYRGVDGFPRINELSKLELCYVRLVARRLWSLRYGA